MGNKPKILEESYKNLEGLFGFLKNFDIERSKKLAYTIRKHKIYLTAMGSSFFFPCKFARDRAIRLGVENPILALPSSELLRTKYFGVGHLIITSLSGKTRENIYLLDWLLTQRFLSITAISYNTTSPLIKKTNRHLFLEGKLEKGILKARGIINLALVLDSLVMSLAINQRRGFDIAKAKEDLRLLSAQADEIAKSDTPKEIIDIFSNAKKVVVIGPDNGVGEEVCISGVKLIRKPFFYIPGTSWFHYMEEAKDDGTLIIALFLEEWDSFMDDALERLSQGNDKVMAIGYKNYGEYDNVKYINLKSNKTFKSYLALIMLWKMFLDIAKHTRKDDLDTYSTYNPYRNVYTG